MDLKIGDVTGAALPGVGKSQKESDGGFAEFFNNTIESLNTMNQDVKAKQERFVTHGDVELQDVMVAGQEAEMALKLTMQLRNKVLDAYREIMRMPV